MNRGALLAATIVIGTMAMGGSAQAVRVTPDSKDFGPVLVGTTSAPQGFLLSTTQPICIVPDGLGGCLVYSTHNVDTTPLGGGPGATTTVGSFLVHNLNCPYPQLTSILATAGSCNFEVSFVPTTFDQVSGYLIFGEPTTGAASVTFTGIGLGTGTPFTDPVDFNLKAAIAKCKKKFPKGPKRKKCTKRARQKAAALS